MFFWLVWGFISVLVACCGVGLLPCWFVGSLVSWSVGSLLCWFSGLLVVCLSAVWPQSPRPGGGWPAGQLDPAPPKGSAVLNQKPNPSGMLTIVKLQALRVIAPCPKFVATWTNFGSMLVEVGRLVGHVRPSCPTWLLLGSTLVQLCPNLVQPSANLAQVGPILAQLGSNLVQFCSQLGSTWS